MKISLSKKQKMVIDAIQSCLDANEKSPNMKTVFTALPEPMSWAKFAAHIEILMDYGIVSRSYDRSGKSMGKGLIICKDKTIMKDEVKYHRWKVEIVPVAPRPWYEEPFNDRWHAEIYRIDRLGEPLPFSCIDIWAITKSGLMKKVEKRIQELKREEKAQEQKETLYF